MKKFTHTEKMGPLHAIAIETEAEKERFNSLLDDGHYLKSRQPSGNTLYQAVLDEAGEWVAIVLWCGGSYRIDPRDTFIGWDGKKREERHGLVTQCSRFMVLDGKRSPNVASQAMGAALRALPGQFAAKYGYAPALAESFSDPELHAGTIYLATGWLKLALSKGFSRDYADYYVRNDRPKVLWVKPLRDGWKDAMCGTALHVADAAVLRPSRLLPFRDDRVESLFGALMGIPDRRRVNRHIPQATVLCVIVLAMLCGRSKVSEFVRFAQGLTPEQKLLLGFPRLKKNRRICKAPSRKTFDAVLKGVSPVRLSEALDGWFRDSLGEMPPALALDGKYVRDKVGTLNVCDTHGRTVCSAPIKKKGKEPLVARAALKTLPRLDGTVVTGDAGNCSAATASEIYTLGGDYILQVKGNQPTVLAFCEASFEGVTGPSAIIRKSNGRLCEKKLMSAPATPMATGIPFCRSVIRVECRTTHKGIVKETVLYYITNLDLRGVPPEELAELLSTHWQSCEIATHWIRDAQYREDFLLVRHPMALLNCTLLINAAAFITNTLRKRRKTSTPALREDFGRRPSLALRILMNPFDASVDF